jgi:TRAP-type C4-dicarboxylate transport system substrate-binding protein
MRMMAWGCALACVVAWSAHAQSPSPAREWKLSTALGPAYPQGKGGELWATLIRERSNGRLAVRHFPGATLAQRNPARELAALREGAIDLAVGSASNWAPQAPELNLIALPWLFPDLAAVDRALEGGVGARLSTGLERVGVVLVAWASDAFHELAAKRGVHAPGDMNGLRVRVFVSPLLDDTLLALGALPAAMSPAAAQAALARGELDAEELSVAALASTRSYAAGTRNLLLWGAHADALAFAVNRGLWDTLSEADRELLRQAARDAAAQAGAMARRQSDDAALAELGRDGVTVIRLTGAGKQPFRNQTRAVYDKWAAVVGEDLVRAAEAAAGAR